MLPNRNQSPKQEISFVFWCMSNDSCLITIEAEYNLLESKECAVACLATLVFLLPSQNK